MAPSSLQRARDLRHLHFRRRKEALHIFHAGSPRDFQSMSVSSSTSRDAILCIRCLDKTMIWSTARTCRPEYGCLPLSSAAPCLCFQPCLEAFQTCELHRYIATEVTGQEHTIYFGTALVSGLHQMPLTRKPNILEWTCSFHLSRPTPQLYAEDGFPPPKTKPLKQSQCQIVSYITQKTSATPCNPHTSAFEVLKLHMLTVPIAAVSS